MGKKISISTIVLLLVGFVVYSLTGVFSKYASMHEFMSLWYIGFFCCTIGTLGIYAVLWQIILKKLPLNIAFLCKSSTIIFSLMFAHFIFSETITLNNCIGAAVILIGLIILAWK